MKTRAALIREVDKPFEIVELDLDEPKASEVLVRFAAAGMCHSDYSMRTGDAPVRYPIVGGHEGAGIVEKVGAGITRLAVGDHVVASFIPACGHCRFCARGKTNLCDLGRFFVDNCLTDGTFRLHEDTTDVGQFCLLGTFSQYAVVSESSVMKIGDDVPFEVAALVSCGVPTGFGTAVKAGDVRPGDVTIVYGIGGVGVNALQGAAYAGARQVIAVDPVEFKRASALRFGATHAVETAAEAHALALSLSDGVGADQALLTIGVMTEEAVSAAFAAVRKGGTVVVTGLTSPASKTVHVPGFELTLFEKRLQGALFGSGNPFDDIPRLLDLYRAGKLKLDELITSRYSLDQINQGYEDMLSGRNIRGVIVHD